MAMTEPQPSVEAEASASKTIFAPLQRAIPNAVATVDRFFQATPGRARVQRLLEALFRHLNLGTPSAMAFDLFLALIPLLGLAGWAASQVLTSQPRALIESSRLLDLTPTRLHGFILRNVDAFSAREVAPALVFGGLWLASSAFVTMIRVFEESVECQPRSWLHVRLLALGFAFLALVLFVVAASAGVVVTWPDPSILRDAVAILEYLHVWSQVVLLASVVSIAAYLALLYRFSMVRAEVERRYWPGALVATALGLASSLGLALYLSGISDYALFYGSLAIIVVVLLWLWLWCLAILVGAELNIALEDLRALRTRTERQGAGARPD